MKRKVFRVGLVLSQLVLFVFFVLDYPSQAQQVQRPLTQLKLRRANILGNLFRPKGISQSIQGAGGGTGGGGFCPYDIVERDGAITACGVQGGFYNSTTCACNWGAIQGGGGGGGPVVPMDDPSPVLFGISPDIWPSGTSTNVTFSGANFGGNPPRLNFSDPSITYSMSSFNSMQIQATVNVPAGTPFENVAVSVTSNGYSGNGVVAGFFSSSGNSPNTGPVTATVITPNASHQVVAVAWVNGNAQDLIDTVNAGPDTPDLKTQLSTPILCGTLIGLWAGSSTTDLNDARDRAYATAFTVKRSGNSQPPQTISDAAAYQSAGNFRLLNVFGAGVKGFTQVGNTPSPCGELFPPNWQKWLSNAEAYPQSGQVGVSGAGNTWQLAEGRVGTIGKLVNRTVNQSTTPWIWSVVEFDAVGNPITLNHAIFPTYYFYVDGSLQSQMTWNQVPVSSFAALDEGYVMPVWNIQ